MNRQQNIKLHKGVDNQIRFRILNLDRKPVSVDHLSLRARLINVENGERVFDRYANLTSHKGYAHLPVFEGDLMRIAPGFYNLVITGEEAFIPQLEIGENMQTPFFIDGDANIVARVEIVGSADPTPRPSTVLMSGDWTVKADAGQPKRYYSSSIPGARIKNHINSLHTFAAYTTGFTGTLQVLATLELQPPDDVHDYFPVNITSGTDTITFDNYTGVSAYTFEANFMWIRFVYTQNDIVESNGTFDKIVIR